MCLCVCACCVHACVCAMCMLSFSFSLCCVMSLCHTVAVSQPPRSRVFPLCPLWCVCSFVPAKNSVLLVILRRRCHRFTYYRTFSNHLLYNHHKHIVCNNGFNDYGFILLWMRCGKKVRQKELFCQRFSPSVLCMCIISWCSCIFWQQKIIFFEKINAKHEL